MEEDSGPLATAEQSAQPTASSTVELRPEPAEDSTEDFCTIRFILPKR